VNIELGRLTSGGCLDVNRGHLRASAAAAAAAAVAAAWCLHVDADRASSGVRSERSRKRR